MDFFAIETNPGILFNLVNELTGGDCLETAQPNQHKKLLLTGLIIALFFAALDGTIVATALPKIVADLNGFDKMVWLTTAYLLTSTAVVPIAGKLSDIFGRRLIYIIGLSTFIIGSALCGQAETMNELIIFRAIQGLGGGIMMPLAMIVVGDIFVGRERAKFQGAFGAVYALASVIGPWVGGVIVDNVSWRWVFYINLPVGLLAITLISLGLRGKHVRKVVSIDYLGMTTMLIGVVSALLALSLGGNSYDWGSWQIIGLIALAVIGIGSFIFVERKAKEPILPIHFFKQRTFVTVNFIGFFMMIGMIGTTTFIPFFMQGIIGMSASDSGTMMAPMMLGMVLSSFIGGRIVYKVGFKRLFLTGMTISATGIFLLTTLTESTTRHVAFSFMAIIGFGMGFVMPTLTLTLQETFPRKDLGVVTSSTMFFRSIGATFGVTLLGVLMNWKSEKLLNDNLVPVLDKIPANQLSSGGQQMLASVYQLIDTDPQNIFRVLLSPDTLKQIPEKIQQTVVPIVQSAMLDSLTFVFTISFSFAVLGIVSAILLPKINLNPKEETSSSDNKARAPGAGLE